MAPANSTCLKTDVPCVTRGTRACRTRLLMIEESHPAFTELAMRHLVVGLLKSLDENKVLCFENTDADSARWATPSPGGK